MQSIWKKWSIDADFDLYLTLTIADSLTYIKNLSHE